MIPAITHTLALVIEKIIEVTAEIILTRLSDKRWPKDAEFATRRELQRALVLATHRYARTGSRLAMAQPLLRENHLFASPRLSSELAKVLSTDERPDYALIGSAWRNAMDDPPQWRDFEHEAKLLLGYFEKELRDSEIFRALFDSRSLDALRDSMSATGLSIMAVEDHLGELVRLSQSPYGEATNRYEMVPAKIHDHIYDFGHYISEKTSDFVGRRFVLEAIDNFMATNRRGYFLISGDPGIGKTSIAAKIVLDKGYPCHFNVLSEGITSQEAFLLNICAQLIALHGLGYQQLPQHASRDAAFLIRLLGEASAQKSLPRPIVIVVDALDEADLDISKHGGNLLSLPHLLPQHTYVIITTRRTNLRLRIECEHKRFEIRHDSSENISDIKNYLFERSTSQGITRYLEDQSLTRLDFVERMIDKSEGNFMYLRHVLPEIEQGGYRSADVRSIPKGLDNYYSDHWRRMRGRNRDNWLTLKLPILVALSAVRSPVDFDSLVVFSRITNRSIVRDALDEWSPFLRTSFAHTDQGLATLYSFYHNSFREFLGQQPLVQDSLSEMHRRIANVLWEDFFRTT
jgi:hypothetical protein